MFRVFLVLVECDLITSHLLLMVSACPPAMDHGCVDGVILVITQRVAVGGEPKTAEGGLGIYKRDKGKGVVFVRDKNWNYCRQSHPGNVSGIKPEERLKMLSWD